MVVLLFREVHLALVQFVMPANAVAATAFLWRHVCPEQIAHDCLALLGSRLFCVTCTACTACVGGSSACALLVKDHPVAAIHNKVNSCTDIGHAKSEHIAALKERGCVCVCFSTARKQLAAPGLRAWTKCKDRHDHERNDSVTNNLLVVLSIMSATKCSN